ncbi:MAG: hypothetical protein ACOY9J_07520 [Pseudomonadota bacterium]
MKILVKACSFLMVLLFGTSPYAAETKKFGDWFVDLDKTYAEAYSSNSSGSTIGMFCLKSSQECMYYLSTGDTCTVDTKTIGLINAETGAWSVELYCTKIEDGRHINFFTNFDEIDHLIKSNKSVGLALPMKDGQFKAVRFSLLGSEKATMEAAQFISTGAPSDTYL